jgi:hypothetical protein
MRILIKKRIQNLGIKIQNEKTTYKEFSRPHRLTKGETFLLVYGFF